MSDKQRKIIQHSFNTICRFLSEHNYPVDVLAIKYDSRTNSYHIGIYWKKSTYNYMDYLDSSEIRTGIKKLVNTYYSMNINKIITFPNYRYFLAFRGNSTRVIWGKPNVNPTFKSNLSCIMARP